MKEDEESEDLMREDDFKESKQQSESSLGQSAFGSLDEKIKNGEFLEEQNIRNLEGIKLNFCH